MSEIVIEAQGLTKRYNGFTAVDHLDLEIRAGEVYGILGPNGSGKTTTILMLRGLTDPTEGKVRVLGLDPTRYPLQIKARVGYIPDRVGFYDDLSAWDNLMYTARLNGLPYAEAQKRIQQALERVGLAEVAHKPVRTYSLGMRQRLGVADVLIKDPDIIIMDEPTQGLDPESAREFLGYIQDLKEEGITILLSSHLLHQVQQVCDRVGLFYRGRKGLEGTVPDLARRILGSAYHIQVTLQNDAEAVRPALEALKGVQAVEVKDEHTLLLKTLDDIRPEVAQAVVQNGGRLLSLDLDLPSLDDIYTRYFQEVRHEEGEG